MPQETSPVSPGRSPSRYASLSREGRRELLERRRRRNRDGYGGIIGSSSSEDYTTTKSLPQHQSLQQPRITDPDENGTVGRKADYPDHELQSAKSASFEESRGKKSLVAKRADTLRGVASQTHAFPDDEVPSSKSDSFKENHTEQFLVARRANAFGGMTTTIKRDNTTKPLTVSPITTGETTNSREVPIPSLHQSSRERFSPISPRAKDRHESGIDGKVGKAKPKSSSSVGNMTATTSSSSTWHTPKGYAALDDNSLKSGYMTKTPEESTSEKKTRQTAEVKYIPIQAQVPYVNAIETVASPSRELKFYRIVYRGVVALLSKPDTTSAKSGAYVSYGDIIATSQEIEIPIPVVESETYRYSSFAQRTDSKVPQDANTSPPPSVLSQNSCSVSSLDTSRTASTAGPLVTSLPLAPSAFSLEQQHDLVIDKMFQPVMTAIRVDDVLTGGYAVDAEGDHEEAWRSTDKPVKVSSTPKRSNAQTDNVIGPSPSERDGKPENDAVHPSGEIAPYAKGYLFAKRKNILIAEQLRFPPVCRHGNFLYKVSSSTPLPILAGPSEDAPKTQAVALPGTVHEVCLKMIPRNSNDGLEFLRLSHRKGWIADRRISLSRPGNHAKVAVLMTEVHDDFHTADEGSVAGISIGSSTAATPASFARRRHRPPRRLKEKSKEKHTTRRKAHNTDADESFLSAQTPLKPRKFGNTAYGIGTPSTTGLPESVMSPASNVSMLSDDSFIASSTGRSPVRDGSIKKESHDITSLAHGMSRDQEEETFDNRIPPISSIPSIPMGAAVFLMRVTAPKGLQILDAPHFQVSKLIRGDAAVKKETSVPSREHPSIFQTMSGSFASESGFEVTAMSNGRARFLPRGAMFEASQRTEHSDMYNRGSGLIRLLDDSGWAIVPHRDELEIQYRNYQGGITGFREGEGLTAYEEIGNAIESSMVDDSEDLHDKSSTIWLRVVSKNGVLVSCPPPFQEDDPKAYDQGNDPSPESSACESSVSGAESKYGLMSSKGSDVTSSVGSALLDAMFRTPKKQERNTAREVDTTIKDELKRRQDIKEIMQQPPMIPCGMCVEVDLWEPRENVVAGSTYQRFARLKGGQGWIPVESNGETFSVRTLEPKLRFGSFWFWVKDPRGVKVRLGPSRMAASIKSDVGKYFRFECGEFLRASEIITVYKHRGDDRGRHVASESFAKLFRHKHSQLNGSNMSGGSNGRDFRPLYSFATSGEWVQIGSEGREYLQETSDAPKIERLAEGWRYNAVWEAGAQVRKGPSMLSDAADKVLRAGESVLINEKVTAHGGATTWLRLQDGHGWVQDVGEDGKQIMIAHSLRHRKKTGIAPKNGALETDEAAFNTIIARLFPDNGRDLASGI